MKNKIEFRTIVLASFVLHILASFLSSGWYNPDEQTCILEYVNFKLGISSNPCFLNIELKNQLVSDSSLKIRSWSQPFFYFLLTKISLFLNINDPFSITYVLKIVSSMIGFFSTYYFFIKTENHFNNNFSKKIYLYSSFLIFYLTFFHTRTSAENFGISFLIIGLAYYFSNNINFKNLNFFYLGFIFGLSFIFRYNLGITIFCIIIYITIIHNNKLNIKFAKFFYLSLGILIVCLFDFLTALWGFNKIQSIKIENLYNYEFLLNNITWLQFLLCGIFNDFCGGGSWNPKPFLYYFIFILLEFFPPLSIIIIFVICFFWMRGYKNIIFWSTLPYFLVHSLIPHKELRFIFPIVIFTPYFLAYFFEKINLQKLNIKILSIVVTCFIINILGLIYYSSTSHKSELKLLKYIYYSPEIKNIEFINSKNEIKFYESLNPFNIDSISNNYYFRFKNIKLVEEIKENKDLIVHWSQINCSSECIKKEQISIKNNRSKYMLFLKNNNEKPEMNIYLKVIEKNILSEYINKLDFKEKKYFLTKSLKVNQYFKNQPQCKLIKNSLPLWILNITFNEINKRLDFLNLYRCELQ